MGEDTVGELNMALVHHGTTFGAVVEAVMRERGLSFQSLNAGFTDAQHQLERAQPSVIVLDGSSGRVSKALTVHQLFRLCPGTVVIQVWPDNRPVEIHRSPRFHVHHHGDLVDLIREIASSQGDRGA